MPNAGPDASFDLVVVGSGGGPFETNLSAYLLKPSSKTWEDGIVGLEAGSGVGALSNLLLKNKSLFERPNNKKRFNAATIYSFIKCFVITHAHLDHVNSLILSAGSLQGGQKRIYALKETLQDLDEHIFSDRVWPKLATFDDRDTTCPLLYKRLQVNASYETIYPGITVRTFLLNHGQNRDGPYHSSAHLLRNEDNGQRILFFGDTGPDSLAQEPRLKLLWDAVAPLVGRTLRSIIIECSWPLGRKDEELYGHFSPKHLCEELANLGRSVRAERMKDSTPSDDPTNGRAENGHHGVSHTVSEGSTPCTYPEDSAPSSEGEAEEPEPSRKKRRIDPDDGLEDVLKGITVYITHFKDDMSSNASPDDPPVRKVIEHQLRHLVECRGLGATITALEPGMHLRL